MHKLQFFTKNIYYTNVKNGDAKGNQAYSEYKLVLANILRSRYVTRTPPLEARSPDRCSNVENARRRRPVTCQPATPTCDIRRAMLRTPPSPTRHLSATRAHPRINYGSRYVAIATQPVPQLLIRPIVHN